MKNWRGKKTDFAVTPFSLSQKGPELVVLFDFNTNGTQIVVYIVVDFASFNEQDCSFQGDEKV